jgi:hypothetical protein
VSGDSIVPTTARIETGIDVGVQERAAAAFAKMGLTVLNALCIK